MRERFTDALGARAVTALLRGADISFAFEGDDWRVDLRASDGALGTGGEPSFVVRAGDDVWTRLLERQPEAGWQSLVHLVRTGAANASGDADEYARHLHLVRAVIEAARGGQQRATVEEPFRPARPLRARGEYRRVASDLGVSDVFIERCGSGTQVLALATAGSDTSQWHGLMTESDFTDRFELVTVDLPWHGRSSPTFGTPVGDWKLTPEGYTDFITAASDAAGLENPVLLGASMAGAAVVHAVATHPGRFAGAVSCQAGPRVRGRSNRLLRATDVSQATFVPEWTYGLMNPSSPEEFRKRVWWGYSSGGYGTYAADIDSYQQWDIDTVIGLLSPQSPHIAVLSGSFDTTVPPAASRALSDLIPNSSFVEMPELGHFPHAENPARFAHYLEDALARVRANPRPHPHQD